MRQSLIHLLAACAAVIPVASGQECEPLLLVPTTTSDTAGRGTCVAVDQGRVLTAVDTDQAALFEPDGLGGWIETAIVPQDALAGHLVELRACDIEGDRLVLGGIYAHGNSRYSGAVYVFDWDGASWVETKVVAPAGRIFDNFGGALALDGDRLMVGAPAYGSGSSVYFFMRDASGWQLETHVPSPVSLNNIFFGSSVALDGDLAVAGAPTYLGGLGLIASGRAWIMERDGAGTWSIVERLSATPPTERELFGWGVSIQGDRVVVGARVDYAASGPITSGSVYVFDRIGPAFVETAVLKGGAGADHDNFGSSVHLEGAELLVGAPLSNPDGNYSGSAFRFRYEGGRWTEVARVFPQGSPGLEFGWDVDFDGQVEAYADPTSIQTGYAWVRRGSRHVDAFGYCEASAEAPCSNSYLYGGCDNSTGLGARLSACGSASLALDDLTLSVTQLPAGQPGMILMGTTPGGSPLGDGLRFAGGELFRFPPGSTGSGAFSAGPGLGAQSTMLFPPAGHITAGRTWFFQAWYRDPAGPCSNGSNLSNALAVRFVP